MTFSGLFKRKIPTIIGLLILFVGGGVGIFLVGTQTNFLPRASAEHAPKELKITNVTDRSFTVSWITDQSTTGFLRYGTTVSLGSTIEDERDQLSGNTGNFRTHYVTVRGLTAGTKYYFKIGSGTSQRLYDNNGQPYQITLGPALAAPPNSQVASGTVVTAAQTPAEGAIVYLQLSGGAPLSALVRASGSWAITLSNARVTDLSNYLSFGLTDSAAYEIIGPNGQTATGSLTVSSLNPAPTITLGQDKAVGAAKTAAMADTKTKTDTDPDIDSDSSSTASSGLNDTDKDLDEDKEASDSASGFSLDPLDENGNDSSASADITLDNPRRSGEKINTTQPEFQGTADPGTTLKITVESDPVYKDTVIVDEDGNFSWTPPDDLEPGEHTITITKADGSKLVRKFVVAAPGTSQLPALTSSASGKTTPTPKPTTTPKASSSGRTSQPSTQSGVPVAGVLTPTLLLFIMGIGLIGSGIFLAKKMP